MGPTARNSARRLACMRTFRQRAQPASACLRFRWLDGSSIGSTSTQTARLSNGSVSIERVHARLPGRFTDDRRCFCRGKPRDRHLVRPSGAGGAPFESCTRGPTIWPITDRNRATRPVRRKGGTPGADDGQAELGESTDGQVSRLRDRLRRMTRRPTNSQPGRQGARLARRHTLPTGRRARLLWVASRSRKPRRSLQAHLQAHLQSHLQAAPKPAPVAKRTLDSSAPLSQARR